MQVLPQDVDSQHGIAQSPIGPSPSQSPLAFQPFGSAPSGPLSAYTSALARSTFASGSGNISKLNRSISGSTATASRNQAAADSATASEHHDAAPGLDGRGASLGARQQTTAATPASDDGSVHDNTSQTNTLQDNAQSAEQTSQPTSPSPSRHLGTTRLSGSTQAAPQQSQSVQIRGDAAGGGISQPITNQSPTDIQELAQQAPTNAIAQAADESQDAASQAAGESQDAASQAAGESQAAASQAAGESQAADGELQHATSQAADQSQAAADAPSESELQQSMDAVLRGEDQAMQESMAAANAAGGEQLKDLLPTPSSEGDPPAQADCPSPTHPTLIQASDPASTAAVLQGAASSPDVLTVPSAVLGVAADKTADVAAEVTVAAEMTSPAVPNSGQEQQLEQAETSGSEGAEISAEASDNTAAGQTSSSGQLADRFRLSSNIHA